MPSDIFVSSERFFCRRKAVDRTGKIPRFERARKLSFSRVTSRRIFSENGRVFRALLIRGHNLEECYPESLTNIRFQIGSNPVHTKPKMMNNGSKVARVPFVFLWAAVAAAILALRFLRLKILEASIVRICGLTIT